jgi:chromosome partitioning protein
MLTITVSSLSGGQGKTTATLFLGLRLAERGYTVLLVDADPQASLTVYLGHEVEANSPTLLELLKKTVPIEDTIYNLEANENLFLIPADDALNGVQDYLSASGVGATLLKHRLDKIASDFQICLIDSPPQRTQIALTTIGAADYILIPCETTVKGFGSLVRTLDLLTSLKEVKATSAEILGVLPFRDRWIGMNQSTESRMIVEGMSEEVGKELVLPSVRESERYKQALNKRISVRKLGYPDLEYPFEVLSQKIVKYLEA